MAGSRSVVHPYIPNSVPEVQQTMLAEVGARSTEDFYSDIPEALRLRRELRLPAPLASEARLKRHLDGLLSQNRPCRPGLSFLGAGCYPHHVPALCDEINGRSEFLTAYAGEPYDDHGRFQALWEYASMMGELLNMDVVNVPTYDGYQAAATAVRMAARVTDRRRVLLAANVDPDKRKAMENYGRADLDFAVVPWDADTGGLDRSALASALTATTACVYFDQPNYFGLVEDGPSVAAIVQAAGALVVVGVDPSTLGVLAPPADWGASIVCGDIQPLGIHMSWGGGHGGFIATHDQEAMVMQFPSRLFGITPTEVPGEYGFGDVAYCRTSFDKREGGNEFVGTAAALWGITAGVYLACLGPRGMVELGEGMLARTHYARSRLRAVRGLRVLHDAGVSVKELIVSFDPCGRTVAAVNQALLERGIVGGRDLSSQYPELGQSALLCFTELHARDDIDQLVEAIEEVIR